MLTPIFISLDQKNVVFAVRTGKQTRYRVLRQAKNTSWSFTETTFNTRGAAFWHLGIKGGSA